MNVLIENLNTCNKAWKWELKIERFYGYKERMGEGLKKGYKRYKE